MSAAIAHGERDQRAQRWRVLQTDAPLRRQIDTDDHAPPPCRSLLMRNMHDWDKAFGIAPGDTHYLTPELRIRCEASRPLPEQGAGE